MALFGALGARIVPQDKAKRPFDSIFNPPDWAIHENPEPQSAASLPGQFDEPTQQGAMRAEQMMAAGLSASPTPTAMPMPGMQQPRGMFGAALIEDSKRREADMGLIASDAHRMAQRVSTMQPAQPKRKAFGENGFLTHALGMMGDALSGNNFYAQTMMRRRESERQDQQRQQDRAWQVEDRDAKLNAPEYFMSGRDRVMWDPRSKQPTVIYDGPEDHETYARQFGEPGTPEYEEAAQDFVLRGNGPTAYAFDVGLENARSGNREALEGVRQRNRLNLRQTPTFAQANPRADGGGGGGRGGSPRPTMTGVVAPILAKVSRGEPLTPAEQKAWSMYRPSRASGGGGGKPKASGPTATDPKTGRKVQWNGSAWVPAG